ncbi:MAG TPA: MBL fold metallo-hydrolase [Dehalococcoidia bacterium]|nr:MBL fold metallo-hydrolase [Dehalococcoidia bacterium]
MPAKYRLGALDLAIISDGTFFQDAGAVFGIVPRIMWEGYAGQLDERHRMSLALNSVVLRSQGKLVLIETGVGDKPRTGRDNATPADQGNLLADLAKLGIRPEEVDIVINTHLHFDHCGWNTRYLDGNLSLTFPNAEYLITRAEWEAALNPNERTRATYLAENLAPLRDSDHLHLIDGEHRVTDEITIVPTPGHSEGHASVVLSSRGETAVYIGDMAQAVVQLERTAWVSSFDILPLVSMETKKAIVERAIEQGQVIISVHAPFPGVGRMTREGNFRKWVDLETEPA